jgi:hypothetical protein
MKLHQLFERINRSSIFINCSCSLQFFDEKQKKSLEFWDKVRQFRGRALRKKYLNVSKWYDSDRILMGIIVKNSDL